MSVKIVNITLNENELPVMIINLKNKCIISIPTQLGCAIGCTFCISSESTFKRNLTAKEMVSLASFGLANTHHKSALISFTGEGEPFLNLKQINQAMDILHNRPDVHAFRLCTSGIKPTLFSHVARYSVPVNLQLSLHSPFDKQRKEIIPKSKPISQIIENLHAATSNFDEIAINYVLMKGVNDSYLDKVELANIVSKHWIVKFNPLLDEGKYKKSDQLENFLSALQQKGKQAISFNSIGSKINNGLYGNLTHAKSNRIA